MKPATRHEVTIFPTRRGAFPPASFWHYEDAAAYMREQQAIPGPFGICQCSAGSFELHWRGVREYDRDCSSRKPK